MKRKKKEWFSWDDERGVVKHPADRQAIQLLIDPASYAFRAHCGKLLVRTLNAEIKYSMKGAK